MNNKTMTIFFVGLGVGLILANTKVSVGRGSNLPVPQSTQPQSNKVIRFPDRLSV